MARLILLQRKQTSYTGERKTDYGIARRVARTQNPDWMKMPQLTEVHGCVGFTTARSNRLRS